MVRVENLAGSTPAAVDGPAAAVDGPAAAACSAIIDLKLGLFLRPLCGREGLLGKGVDGLQFLLQHRLNQSVPF